MSSLWEIGTEKETPSQREALEEATNVDEIIKELITEEWNAMDNDSEPPIPTIDDIRKRHTLKETTPLLVVIADMLRYVRENGLDAKPDLSDFMEESLFHNARCCFHIESAYPPPEGLDDVTEDDYQKAIELMNQGDRPKQIGRIDYDDFELHLQIRRWIDDAQFAFVQIFDSQRFTAEDANDGILAIHRIWTIATILNKKLKHPLAPIVRAWLIDQNAKHITKEYDDKHPVGVFKTPMGSIRELSFIAPGDARLREFATPESTDQLQLPSAQEKPSILPPVVPLEVAHPHGLPTQTKKGAVSHVLRIFDEALMALEPSETQANIMFTLGELLGYLYPGYQREDGSYNHTKFNRTNQLPYIINALEVLHFYATVPWDNGNGRWRPVVVRTPLRPDAKNDAKIFLDVRLPPDARQGMMVEKAILRQLGKESAPKYYAYRIACWLLDKYGTVQGKLSDPTRPVERRNDATHLLANGKRIVSPQGKPITNLYNTNAVRQLPREPNPDAIQRYPVLSDEDLILACFPNTIDKNPRQLLKRAKGYWTELEKEGIVSIQKEKSGWRILPSERHLKAHRGLREAIKKS